MADTEQLIALAERVERAEGPDRELDALIEVAVFGFPQRAYDQANGLRNRGADPLDKMLWLKNWGVPRYSASLDAAMTLVPEGWRVGFEQGSRFDHAPEMCMAWVWPFASEYDPDWQLGQEGQQSNPDAQKGYAATPALALCAASLRAMAEQKGEPARAALKEQPK
jgi:hypothetical protein